MMKYVKLIYSTEAHCVFEMSQLDNMMDEIRDSDVGQTWTIEIVEMSEEEYESLPEFSGP